MLGLKSTALRLGEATRPALVGFYSGALVLWGLAAWLAGAGWPTWITLAVVGMQLGWQVATLDIDDSGNCLVRFKSNRLVGWLIFGGVSADMAISAALRAG